MTAPRFHHAIVCCTLLIALSIALFPLSLTISILQYFISAEKKVARTKKESRPVALINGGRMQKSIYIARALSASGYRVVLAEERGWGELCAARFFNAVDHFVLVQGGGGKEYVDAMVHLIIKEKVQLFIPCSGAGTTIEDAQVAELVRKRSGGKIKTLIQDADLVETLHEKDRFVSLVLDLKMDAPASYHIKTPEEAMTLLRQPGQPPMILKAANVLDDVGRGDLTNFPLLDRRGKADWTRTEQRLTSGLHIPMTPKTPYIAQEFVGGKQASEWCTHATVIDGKITAFVCCPSNDLLMTYHNATHSIIGRRALSWTEIFLSRLSQHARWKNTRLTGQFSMDFIHQPSSDRLVVIECNPRVHTAIGLLTGDEMTNRRLGQALQGKNKSNVLLPSIGAGPMSWWGHDLVTRYLPSFTLLPEPIMRLLHPLWTKQVNLSHPLYNLEAIGKEASWDSRDPFAFWALYHIQMPFLLLRQLFLRRRGYSRINISTARIFEC